MGRLALASAFIGVTILLVGTWGGLLITPVAAVELGWGTPARLAETASHPKVATDVSGGSLVVWGELHGISSSVWAIRHAEGDGWSVPVQIGTYDDWRWRRAPEPDVAVDANGNAFVVWQHKDLGPSWFNASIRASRFVSGAGWSAPAEITGPDSRIEVELVEGYASCCAISIPQVAVNAAGHAIVVWSRSNDSGGQIWAARYVVGDGWGTPELIWSERTSFGYSAYFGRLVALDDGGNAIVVWRDSGSRHTVWASRYVTDVGWQPATIIGDGGHHSFLQGSYALDIASHPHGVAVVTWNVWDRDRDARSIAAAFYEPTGGWRNATTINEGPSDLLAFEPRAAVNGAGNALVVWLQYSMASEERILYASQSLAGGGWGTPIEVGAGEGTYGHRLAFNSEGDAIVTWYQGGERGDSGPGIVWARRLVPALGWEPTIQIGKGRTPEIDVDSMEGATIVWVRNHGVGDERGLWASQFSSLSMAVLELEEELRGTQDTLRDTQHALRDTQEALAKSRGDLEAAQQTLGETRSALDAVTAGLASANNRVVLLLGLQAAFAGVSLVLFGMYWNLRRIRPGAWTRLRSLGRHSRSEESRNFTRTRRGWPASRARGGVQLTSKERILLHLLDSFVGQDAREASREQTQTGIADATGVDLRHFAQYVRPLIADGLVEERSAYVQGMLQRRKVYDLTPYGVRSALGIRDRAQSAVVPVRDSSGVRETTLAEVLATTRGTLSILQVVRELTENGAVDLRPWRR